MLEWWLAPLSGASDHQVPAAVAWHARLMVLAWGVLAPVGVLWARFWKVTPRQDWPNELDNASWWHAHRALQSAAVAIAVGGVAFVVKTGTGNAPVAHWGLGWFVVVAGLWQVLHGFARGSKGGPTAPTLQGDHYDMTRWRVVFERVHKSLGWIAVLGAIAAIGTGLIAADAPRWMPALLLAWWAVLAAAFAIWQRAGRTLDTYQAIWGPDSTLPGNRRPPIGWGVVRRTPRSRCGTTRHIDTREDA